MLKSTVARGLLLASALATGAIGAALAQPQTAPSQPAVPAQTQGQTQAQPLGNAGASEGLHGIPVDQVSTVNGVETVCSGIGKGDETSPPSNGYPVKFEMVGGYGQWLGNERLTISGNGMQDISVQCSGPWVLMKLNPGNYSVTADVPGAGSKTQKVTVPATGTREVIFRFTNLQQGQSPEHDQNAPANGT